MCAVEIAVIQGTYTNQQVNENLEKMIKQVQTCMVNFPNVQCILFPELCVTGYFLSGKIREVADQTLGEHFSVMSKVAKDHRVYIAYGYVEKGEKNAIYNSLLLIDSKGQFVGNYRKIHLTPLEKNYFTEGSEFVVVSTTFGKIGLMICWDLAFPELARSLAIEDADIILSPCAWEVPYDEPYELFGKARAIDNSLFLVTCNHIGQSDHLKFFGKSAIYGPDGRVIANAVSNDEEIIMAKLSMQQREELKESFFTMHSERRTDLY